jgi:hypothetical protein
MHPRRRHVRMVCPLAALTAARASTYAPAARLARWCCAGPPPVRTTLAWRRRTVPRPRCVLQRPHCIDTVIVSVRGAPRRVHAGTSTPITAVDSLIPSSPLTGSYSVRPGGYALASACTTLPSSCSSYTRHAWTRSNSSTVPSRTLLLRTSRRACTTRQSLTSCRNAAPLSRTHLGVGWLKLRCSHLLVAYTRFPRLESCPSPRASHCDPCATTALRLLLQPGIRTLA